MIQGKIDEHNGKVYISSTSKVWDDAKYEERLKSEVSTLRENL